MNEFFFELIRIAVGSQSRLSRELKYFEWDAILNIAKKHALVGVCFAAIQKLPAEHKPDDSIYLQWMGITAKIQLRNEMLDKACVDLQHKLTEKGFESCILKGQSLVPYYILAGAEQKPNLGLLRQPGDIDVWCKEANLSILVNYVQSLNISYEAKHAHVSFAIDGVVIELHPTPCEFRCPWKNARLQQWFKGFDVSKFDVCNGFKIAPLEFNVVYLLVHLYHHVLFEGIGLRQFLDYYFVLKTLNCSPLKAMYTARTMVTIKRLGMSKVLRGVMYIMQTVFGLPEKMLICEVDPEIGTRLLNDVLNGGNFGKYDEKYDHADGLLKHGWMSMKRRWQWFGIAQWEFLCSPVWSLWQLAWRKCHGYYV